MLMSTIVSWASVALASVSPSTVAAMSPVRVMVSATPLVAAVAKAAFNSASVETLKVASLVANKVKAVVSRADEAATSPVVISSRQSPPTGAPPVASSDAAISAPVAPARALTNAEPISPAPTSQPQIWMSPSGVRARPMLAS